MSCLVAFSAVAAPLDAFNFVEIERARILDKAGRYLDEKPVTVTAESCPRSAGGIHDFYSEGDYWWPDPKNPDGPYIRRDGMSNPNNFVAHRLAMIRLSEITATMASAYIITGDEKYAAHAVEHLRAWFVTPETHMAPHLLYAQAIKGKTTGRKVGIIDTIHLVEVARAAKVLESSQSFSKHDADSVKKWFKQYLRWLNTHPQGQQERDATNNHGTCWVMQVAAFAQFVGDDAQMEWCRDRYKKVLLPNQMAADGSFPLELRRTKPYGYSLFNIDAFAGVCQILSTPEDNLWEYTTEDGRGMRKGMEFIFPYIADKSIWPYKPDVLYYDKWP
ncbi:MAG: alginate lyase family protein, partial [Candidatus Hydrogenedentes bacterium]|nr:alginate lyase family protein [Candidatus Hydrogenedentota bacterium]